MPTRPHLGYPPSSGRVLRTVTRARTVSWPATLTRSRLRRRGVVQVSLGPGEQKQPTQALIPIELVRLVRVVRRAPLIGGAVGLLFSPPAQPHHWREEGESPEYQDQADQAKVDKYLR